MIESIAEGNPLVDNISGFHAGCILTLMENPNPQPQDEDMHFSGIRAGYENWRKKMSYTKDYYPLLIVYSTSEVLDIVGCSIEYVRKVVEDLPSSHAAMITEYNELTRRNESSWRIYSKVLVF